MASPFDPLLDRVTRRLQTDPELRLEVEHELRTHLEESAKEFRAAGRSEDDAIAEASRALGNEEVLAEQLWQANRRRMGTRKIARWAIGGTLVPAASVIAMSTAWTTLLSLALLVSIVSSGTTSDSVLGQAAARRVLAHVPKDERFMVQSDDDAQQHAARAEAILHRLPNDPSAYANYALAQLTIKLDKDDNVDDLLSILKRGESVEPDNALYPLLESAVLFKHSTKIDSNGDAALEYRCATGSMVPFVVSRISVTNQQRFDDAKAAFRSAAERKYLDAHTMDMAKRQFDVLPANSLDSQLLRVSLACQILLPQLQSMRDAFDQIGSVAITAAEKGDRKTAAEWIDAENRIADMAVARSDLLIELIDAARLKESAIGDNAIVLEKFGDHAGFERERDRLNAVEQLLRPRTQSPTSASQIDPKFLSLSDRYFLSSVADTSRINLAPQRTAEFALFDQVSLAIGLLALLFVIGLQLLIATATSIRRSERPKLYFIGWRRLARIILLAILLPAVAYLAYAWSPLSGRIYGAPVLAGVLVVEYSLIGLIMFATFRVMFDAALRERSAELGLEFKNLPASPSRTWRSIALTLGIISIVYIVLERGHIATHNVTGKFSLSVAIGFSIGACIWLFDLFTLLIGTHTTRSGGRATSEICIALLIAAGVGIALFFTGFEGFAIVGICGLLIALIVIAAMRWLRTERVALPQVSWRLAIAPAELLIILVLGVLILPLLQSTERHAANQFLKPVPYIGNEIENSQYHDLRAQLLMDTIPSPPTAN